ncbi:hypothetical protein DUNSADRAFT_16343 [Dunaliella salina]|uniref:Uncharacterized protein n=1 Tax=Dunaliella salina TaxID=3046 RepID=A0ABQ7H114_DUNSA|nr:hypothetical protein DUNSADRAFT_16343 [Dunaliella salina]|eukprot:KAF5840546.1 hypothetical protein DUNSADRAFT_16343 [Dunaliella salina]
MRCGPRLPLRTGLGEDVHQQESPEQLVSRLAWSVRRQQWRKLHHLLLLLKFMARCNPALASQLAQSGGVSALLGVVRGVLQGSPKPRPYEPVLTAALSLLKKVASADLDNAIKAMVHARPASHHTQSMSSSGSNTSSSSSSSNATLLVDVMRDPFSGVQARRKAARLLRCLVNAGYVGELQTEGLLKELPTTLENPITACDFSFLHDVLWCMMALADSEVSMHGMVQQPQALLRVLLPLLYVMCESRSPHLRHLLAAVLRILHVVAANDAVAKEQLQQLGMIDCLVRVICTDHLAAEPHAEQHAQDPRLADSLAWASNGSSSSDPHKGASSGEGAEPSEVAGLQHSPSAKAQQECDSEQQLLDGMDSGAWWWRLWAAALMGPVLRGSQHACLSSSGLAEGAAAGHAGDGVSRNGLGVGEGHGSKACDGGVSASAVCVYALLLPLQRVHPKAVAAAGPEQQWQCPT